MSMFSNDRVRLFFRAVLLGLTTAIGAAPAWSQPVVNCSSPNWIFNTGVDAASGAKLAQGASEPRWQYAAHPIDDTSHYTPPGTWSTPVVKRLSANPWYWTNMGSAEWITPNTGFAATQYTYYRFRFNLDPAQDPAAFQVGMSFEADDAVDAVFINGTKVNGTSPIGGGFEQFPPNSGQYYTIPGQYTLAQGWQAGTNEIVLLVNNSGGSTLTSPKPYSGVLVKGLAMCGSAQVSKSFSPTQVQAGGTSTLTIHVDNQTNPATAVRDLFVKDELPAPLEVAGTPSTTCQNATLTGAIGDTSVSLSGSSSSVDMLPTGGCDITVPVRWPATAAAQCNGTMVTNTITPGPLPNGQFHTALGFNRTPASANLQCMPPPLVLNVQTTGAAGGPFGYALSGTGQAAGSASTAVAGTPVQVDGDSATTGMQPFTVNPGVPLTITQSSLPAGWTLTSAACMRDGMAVGNLAGNTYTVDAADAYGASLACTFTNTASGALRISKLIQGGTPKALAGLNGSIEVQVKCANSFSATASLAVTNGVVTDTVLPGVPVDSSCAVEETHMPAPPAGFVWDAAAYENNPTAIAPAAEAQVKITNRLISNAPAKPAPVPTQSWPMLLMMALGMLALGRKHVMRR